MKESHKAVHYRDGNGNNRCAVCTMFRAPSSCTAVQSPIKPSGLCDLFKRTKDMAKLNAAKRNALPGKDFAGPDRSYPIEDKGHAKDALSRVSANGSPAVKKKVRAAVHKKFPSIGRGKPKYPKVAREYLS